MQEMKRGKETLSFDVSQRYDPLPSAQADVKHEEYTGVHYGSRPQGLVPPIVLYRRSARRNQM